MDKAAWLQARRTGIGSSDAPTVCGLSPWSTPLELYHEKLGTLAPKDQTERMAIGLALEPALSALYEKRTGLKLHERGLIDRHPEHEWMICNVDRLVDGGDRIVELKTADGWARGEWGEPGSDEVPEHYLVQVQHQMAVMGIAVADIAVLIGGVEFRIYTVERSEAIVGALIEIERDFWRKVQRREAPEANWSHPTTPKLIASINGLDEEKTAILDDKAVELVDALESEKKRAKDAQQMADVLKARLLDRLDGAALGQLPDGRAIVRKRVHRKSYTVAECDYIDFRIKAPKKVRV